MTETWAYKTNKGRVVYQRKSHPLDQTAAARLLSKATLRHAEINAGEEIFSGIVETSLHLLLRLIGLSFVTPILWAILHMGVRLLWENGLVSANFILSSYKGAFTSSEEVVA